jgi:hypothetical protein
MTSRLETTGGNVRRIAARIFPEKAAERLAPRAVSDLFTDPWDLASALFASRLTNTADADRDEAPATHVNRLPALEPSRDHRSRAAQSRDFMPASPSASKPLRSSSTAPPLDRLAVTKVFLPAQVSTDAGRRRRLAATAPRVESAGSASAEDAIEPSGSHPIGDGHGSIEHAPATFPLPPADAGDPALIDWSTPFVPVALANDRVRAITAATARSRSREPVTAPPPGSSTRLGAPADEGITRWVKGAAGLATLFAPPKPAVVSTPPAVESSSRASQAGVALDSPTAASVPVIAPALPAAAHSASTDIELLMDELERRLELEYLRHYGTSGR